MSTKEEYQKQLGRIPGLEAYIATLESDNLSQYEEIHRLNGEVLRLERLLAESYAPHKETGEPPRLYAGFCEGKRIYLVSHRRSTHEIWSDSIPEARAAWNAANQRGEG